MSSDFDIACAKLLEISKISDIKTQNDDDGYAKSDSNRSLHSSIEYYTADDTSTESNSSSSGVSSTELKTNDNHRHLQQYLSNITDQFKEIALIEEKIPTPYLPEHRIVYHRGLVIEVDRDRILNGINFLNEHTESCDDFGLNLETSDIIFTRFCSNLVPFAALEAGGSDNNQSVVVKMKNFNKMFPITLLLVNWIDMEKRQIIEMCSTDFASMSIASGETLEFSVPLSKFELRKKYKLVVYYRALSFVFYKEMTVHVTTRPLATMELEPLDHYFPQPELRTLDRCRFKESTKAEFTEQVKSLKEKILVYEKSEAATRLNGDNFYTMFKLMLQMEDETDSKRSLTFDQHTQSVKTEFAKRYSLKISNKRLEEAINEYTRLWITPMSMRFKAVNLNGSNGNQHNGNSKYDRRTVLPRRKNDRIYGSVVQIKEDTVYFELNKPLTMFTQRTKVESANEKYFIRFMNDRQSITLEHRALDYMTEHNISRFFFPNGESLPDEWKQNDFHPSSYFGQPIPWTVDDINDQQKAAVTNILKQTSYPYPYILFGPPGTGKTKTLVEAISQIIRNNNKNEAILVCATSNAACNEVVKRLLNLNANDGFCVFRIFSKSQSFDTTNIPKEVLAASNLSKGEHYYPSLAVLYKYKVIVCTLTTAGRLSQGKINPHHFSHVFIDEAGCATESQIMIAIAGICSTVGKIHSNVILAGDPKQLGPVIKSQQAVKMGFGISTLERLITTSSLYMRNEKTTTFNSNYVTQLIRNYRSHSSILHTSNSLYYGDALEVHAPDANINWFLNSSMLISPQFPMIFHSVKGITMKDGMETSPYNILEIDMVVGYLKRIFATKSRIIQQNDIGIISPYRKQCEELKNRCMMHGWTDIQIGAVEVFQGQEKPIVIVSTVRSNMNNIGFLNSKKRLNVLLTRAKCLLIIIGDAKTLANDEDWKYLVDYCKANNSFVE